MAALPKKTLTPQKYLEIERAAEFKSEFYDGEMFAMAGTNRRHSFIVGDFGGALRTRFKGGVCEVHTTEIRVRVKEDGLYTYPDVVAVCGEPEFLDENEDTLLNPQLIIEVLSKSTEDYDRGKKFLLYRGLESLREYVLVWPDAPHIEQYQKEDAFRWTMVETIGLDRTIHLTSVGCEIPLTEIYERVDFPAGA